MTAAVRLREASRWWTARAAVLAALGGIAGCRGAPATTSPTSTVRATGTPTVLSLDEYGDRLGTAAAVLVVSTAQPGASAARSDAPGRSAALATAAALAGRPVPVALRADAVRRAEARSTGEPRFILAQPLLPTAVPALAAADAVARLDTVRDELDASQGDRTAAQATALERVLADPAFRDPRSLWQRGWEWAAERFRRWWGGRGLSSGAGEAALRIGQAIGWAVAFVVVALTALWVARLIARLSNAPRVPAAPGALPSTPAEARARAEADAGAGDFRSAVRQLYLAALLVLEAQGLLRPDRSRTNREQLASLAGGDALRAHMSAVVDTFDRVWYGVTVPDDGTFRAYADDVHQLEVLARRASNPPAATGPSRPMPGSPASSAGGAP